VVQADEALPRSPWDGTTPLTVTEPVASAAETGVRERTDLWGIARRVGRLLGVDRAIAFTVLARGWASAAGLVTVALIARLLSPAEQGYYYTFGSIVAMQLIFELGFSVVILQLASHETAHLRIGEDGKVEGDERHHARLASVLRKSFHWYTVAAGFMGLVLIPGGWWFFETHAKAGAAVSWHLPWTLVVLASCITFQIDPIFSFLEGCGMVARVARTRFAQAVLGSSMAWLALGTHHGLLAPAAMVGGQAIAGLYWLFRRRALLLGLYRKAIGPNAIHWMEEVWPFQWRIAVSYGCGFFIFQLFNPVLFAYWGPAEAGRMGMSLSLCNALASIAISWINTKSAPFGALIARRRFTELDRTFFRAATQSLALSVIGSAVVWTGTWYLRAHHYAFANRLLPGLPFALLLGSMNINQVVSSMAIYLRAHKQEKFLINSVLGAVLMGSSTYFLGRYFGALGMTSGQFAIAVGVGLGYGTYVFLKYRKLWHQVESGSAAVA
jgi:hypothetical protein